ncbi:MAG: hypothetical protein RIB98_00095 [Acidimicrobiales bacterium]
MTDGEPADLSRQLRRWGPLGAIVAIVLIVVVVVVASGGDDDGDDARTDLDTTTSEPTTDTDPDTDTTTDPDDGTTTSSDTGEDSADDVMADGRVYWTEADAAGVTGDFDWGEKCDTDLGTYAYPDFFAGECVVPWTGDNGGATETGVTADTITIVVYSAAEVDPVLDYITGPISNDDTPDQVFETHVGLAEFYGAYFETYGRTVELVQYKATGTSDDEVAAIADAETIARDLQPFMVWSAPTLQVEVFGETLAANGIMCNCNGGASAQDNYPYLHVVTKSPEQSRILLAEYIGKRLAGRNAIHSGDFTEQERTFGYLYLETSDASTQVAEDFRDALADDYGVTLDPLIPYELDPLTLQEQATTIIASLKSAGVTSIVFAGDPIAPRDFTLAATEQEYFPEWILSGTALVDTSVFGRTYDQEQWAHAFGMSNTSVPIAREVGGNYFLYDWFHGEAPPAGDTIGIQWQASLTYALLQGVGPDLTHENFADAMLNAPPTRRGAITAPSISFGSDKGLWPDEILPDLNGIDDVSEVWWDPETVGVDELDREGPGIYQYVDGGTRYLPGAWPDTDPNVFVPEGAVDRYVTRPASEDPPDYPSPAG